MKKSKVTARDVAKAAGVSPATVSMILNNYSHVSFTEETRVKVLDTCEKLGYQTIGNRRLSFASGRILLIVCPSFANPHYIKEINGIQQRSQELGYETVIFCTNRSKDKEAVLVRVCRELQVAGVILLYQPDNASAFRQLNMENQIVQLYDCAGSSDVSIIQMDNFKIGRMIAKHLIGLGHEHIAYVSFPITKTQPSRQRRIDGIKSYMQEMSLPPEECLKICTVETLPVETCGNLEGYETGYLLGSYLLDHNEQVTAFAAINDMVAYGIMDAVYAHGKKIPQDYSLCGCDNLPDSEYQKISLTSVELFTEAKGQEAVTLLAQKIEAQSRNTSSFEGPVRITRIEYAPKLIVRKSSGKCARILKGSS
ncbi:LacI family DNA-binding transcriptional regulator [uncultured Dysosmobacter sp.]|uniref:LacI family DNA-binding transcriptional regulator n=1 Tax=uncultured Dysosmobacter sp. TaxID=2591384 RepID=UPI00261EA276|nr:LacI family DNA-binding transcriptional regulator [uncultured Dysosmobacter sp.]